MIVANSFDLWQKDTFFSAAEEVQESADAMESAYRRWVRERRETLSPKDLDELCTELQTALGTAKWQLEEFARAVRLSYGHRGNDNTTARHRQFIDAIENQISLVETALRESFNVEGKQPLHWVNLDEDERDELATFLSGTSQSSQSAKDEYLELKPSMKSSLLENHAQRKDADLKYSAACDTDFSNDMEGLKDVSCVKKDGNHVITIESNEIHGRMDDVICQADRITNNTRRTWSSPNFSELKIIIPDEDEPINKLMLSVEDTPKEKGLKPIFRKQRRGEFLQVQGVVNLFNQFGRVGGFQRQLQSPLHLPFRCSVQVTLALMLTIFLIVPFVFYSA
ncbi:uncharacterized protein LOC132189297 isoform X1 [Corylus avellana]|uniref:uncharacterized protein LOC132189297 isoform X1 n=1 Tax=Corylus avellana TaxID=13451 RepID=UPI00286BEB01|nr:uncharacterized protein LOC132189297 isoform X1 [Corylus avellana]